jgi:hypothetical protein
MSLSLLRGRGEGDVVSVDEARSLTIRKRNQMGTMSFGLFILGLLLSALVVREFSTEASATPPTDDQAQKAIAVSPTSGVYCGVLIAGERGGAVALLPSDGADPVALSDVVQLHLVKDCPAQQ